MSLQDQLEAFKSEFARTAPPEHAALYEIKIGELRASFAIDDAVGIGSEARDFALPDAQGKLVSLSTRLRRWPAVVTFYRGGWCPYCNIQLRAYQAILPQMAALGASLAAISPLLPDGSPVTAEKDALTFDVLSDVGNVAARRFGLVYALPEELRAFRRANNGVLPDINGDGAVRLVPADLSRRTDLPTAASAERLLFAASPRYRLNHCNSRSRRDVIPRRMGVGAVNRYRREAERHYRVLDDHLAGREFFVGNSYTIADISAWGWIDRATRVMKGQEEGLTGFAHIKRWFQGINGRPAVARGAIA